MDRKYKWLGPLILGFMLFSMGMLYWRKWGAPIIDYGREVYIPWQLSCGKVLCRDIDYFMGPLGPYMNTLWFKISGVSITTLFVFNLAIIAILTYIIYLLIEMICDQTTATLSGLTFLIIFAFSHSLTFNFVSPYDYNLTYGFLFTIVMIYFLFLYQYQPNILLIIGAGLCLGLVFLTKAEVFLAALMTAIVALMITQRIFKLRDLNQSLSLNFIIIIFLVSILIPIFSFFTYFSFKMPLSQAFQATIGNWYFIFATEITKLAFYKTVTGLDEPFKNIFLMLVMFLIIILMITGGLIIEFTKNKFFKNRKLIILMLISLLLILCPALYFSNMGKANDFNIGRPLPLFSLITIIASLLLFIKLKISPEDTLKFGQIVIWSVFSFCFLYKTILHSRLSFYGFVLAIPATISLIITTIWLIPKLLLVFYGRCYVFRRLAISGFTLLLFGIFIFHYSLYSQKTQIIGSGEDKFYIYNFSEYAITGKLFDQMVNYIKTSIPAQASLLVLPEGVMINYLTRHQAPIHLISFIPPEIAAFGEPYIIKSLTNHPPNYIVVLQRQFQKESFGTDWGKRIVIWVKENYALVKQFGADPLKCGKFGISLLKRKSNLPYKEVQN